MTPEEVLQFAKKHDAKIVDFKFVDVPGTWQHFSVPLHELNEETFVDGVPFDGSSIRGFQTIHESDMLIIPDPTTALMDPFTVVPTLSLVCNIAHPGPAGRKRSYTRDPRYIAQKAEAYLRSSGIADTSYFGPESEFYIFDNIRYNSSDNIQYAEIRTEMVLLLEELGMPVETHHHEVGGPGQAEIDIHYNTLLKTADNVMLYKYVVKNTARRHGKTVTFMPKPVFGDNGSGMHVHQSLWKGERPLFYDAEGYAGLSQTARYYIGGLLTHAPALLAIAASTTNSYKRLVPGYEAPVNLVFSKGNRSAAVRIPLTECPSAKRVEFRPPDPTANPYLTFSALLMAGLDGIRHHIDPSDHGYGPVDRDLYHMSKEELHEIRSVPGPLSEALDALESDYSFLLEGNVFTTDMLEQYVELKRAQSDAVRLRPAPIEFALYYDA